MIPFGSQAHASDAWRPSWNIQISLSNALTTICKVRLAFRPRQGWASVGYRKRDLEYRQRGAKDTDTANASNETSQPGQYSRQHSLEEFTAAANCPLLLRRLAVLLLLLLLLLLLQLAQ